MWVSRRRRMSNSSRAYSDIQEYGQICAIQKLTLYRHFNAAQLGLSGVKMYPPPRTNVIGYVGSGWKKKNKIPQGQTISCSVLIVADNKTSVFKKKIPSFSTESEIGSKAPSQNIRGCCDQSTLIKHFDKSLVLPTTTACGSEGFTVYHVAHSIHKYALCACK